MVNRSFSSHYYDYPMGDGSGTARGGKGDGGKKRNSSPCPESQPVLSTWALRRPLSFFVSPMKYVAYAPTIEATKSNFFPFIDPPRGLPLSRRRKVAHADAPHAAVVGRSRICKFRRRIVCLRAAPYSPPLRRAVHKRSRSNFHPVRNFYFLIERNDKAGHPVPRRKGDGTRR